MPFKFFVAACIAMAWTNAASATTRYVPSQYSTIQGAINASSSGDLILVSPGTYYESINFGGRNLTLRSTGGAASNTISALGLNRRVVQFTGGEGNSAVLDGFTLRDGNPMTGTLVGHGGGILICWNSTPTILNCVIRNNTADLGGGVYVCLNSSGARIGNTSVCSCTGSDF